jgi:hypothetical protein
MDEKELLTEPRFLKGRILEERSEHSYPIPGLDVDIRRRETLFYCEDLEKCITLFVDVDIYTKELLNKRVSAEVRMDDNIYCCDTLFYIFEDGHDDLMIEVERLLYRYDNNRYLESTEFSPRAFDLYLILTQPPAKPIPLNLFIEGYKEPEDTDEFYHNQLQSIKHYCFYSCHQRLYSHILHQWAIYNCFYAFKSGRLYISTIEGLFKEGLAGENQDDGICEFFDKACSLLSEIICYGNKLNTYLRRIRQRTNDL